jgi:hypothetical protein
MKRHYLERFHTTVVDVHHIAGSDDDESLSSGFHIYIDWMEDAGEKEESARMKNINIHKYPIEFVQYIYTQIYIFNLEYNG